MHETLKQPEWVESFGDSIYDLCVCTLWHTAHAQHAFRVITRTIEQKKNQNQFETYLRPWIFKIAVETLRTMFAKNARKPSALEQVSLDSELSLEEKFARFELYFHKLSFDEKVVLLLRDKYGLPYSEIAAIFSLPEDSIKLRRTLALRTLDDSIWKPQ